MFLPFFKKRKFNVKPVVLLILDGFGIAPPSLGNPISKAKTPNLDSLAKTYPYTQLIASGESVGLPANEAGNSEVGHLTIGVGRVVYQSLPRINMAIEDGNFFENRAFLQAVNHIKIYGSKLHLMGLIGSGTVHSSNEHLFALLDFCYRNKLKGVYLHLFTDGRDSPPTDAIKVAQTIEEKLSESDIRIAQISTISGRYYAMDRDGRWERTQKTYDAIVSAKGLHAPSAVDAIQNSYNQGKTDEFIEPTIIDKSSPYQGVADNDAIIFFNFRIDRPRQLTMAFVFRDFEERKFIEFGYIPHESSKQKEASEGPTFKREKWPQNLFFVTMTEYQKNLPVSAIAFPPQEIANSLSEILSNKGLKQLHLAESEKERMVTFYFNGMREGKFPGEDDLIVPSPNVATYDKQPEMSAFKVLNQFKKNLYKDFYHFIVINFANPDMVGHSGNVSATVAALEVVDKVVGTIVSETLNSQGAVFITADHGNAEELLTYPTGTFFYTSSGGNVNTEHSNNPVPFYVISRSFQIVGKNLPKGNLSDVAPTILSYMGIRTVAEMTGSNLLKEFFTQPTGVNKTEI